MINEFDYSWIHIYLLTSLKTEQQVKYLRLTKTKTGDTRYKYADSVMSKLLDILGGGVVKQVGDVLDKLTTTKEEKLSCTTKDRRGFS